ncbi:Erythroid differentiation-related factor 1 [Bienertia sinuspersici]
MQHPAISESFSICACGDTDCIEVCDIREWLPTLKLDHKLWKLILLLGESYLALGQAYREDGQLLQALKIVEVACSVYGSVPQYLQDAKFISSMGNGRSWINGVNTREEQGPLISDKTQSCKSSSDDHINPEDLSLTYLFWAQAWMLVGDVYVEFLNVHGKHSSSPSTQTHSAQELKMSSEVVKELMRLKKKLGQDVENCSTCSLVNCSCQSDRASSGISASSSSRDTKPFNHGKRQNKRSNLRSVATSHSASTENNHLQCEDVLGRNAVSTRDRKDSDPTIEKHDMTTGLNWEKSSSSTSCSNDHDEKSLSSATLEDSKTALDESDTGSFIDSSCDTSSGESPKSRSGGIFKYLQGPGSTDTDNILSCALFCYEAAGNSLGELSTGSDEMLSVFKKIGWVCNELGRIRLERKNLAKAETAFVKAIDAFREVSDHTNIILINCNLGHGRRASAEEMVSKVEYFKSKSILRDAYVQALDAAKVEYGKSLKFYEAAKTELIYISGDADNLLTDLGNEVYTQFAHTYLRLGMLLAREDTVADAYMNGTVQDKPMGFQGLGDKRTKKGHKKSEISANDAIREALSIYESLGELRKQEAAYAYFQLACYQRDTCLKFSNLNHRSNKSENGILQRVKQYHSLAERNWQKAIEFYSAKRHPIMYLTILIERAALLSSLSSVYHSHMMLETALTCLLDGRHISEQLHSDSTTNVTSDVSAKFWTQLQMLLKKMLASSLSTAPSKTAVASQTLSKRSGDAEKLKELYKMSLKSPDFYQLQFMNSLWTGSDKTTEGSD